MARYILIRVLGLIGVLLIVSVITFVLMHEVPGGPWQYGERPFTDQQLAALKKLYGLDKPLIEQYFSWLRGVLRLDFGRSFQYPDRSVTGLIRDTWPTTLHLGLMTIIVAFGLGLPLGIIAALRQNTWIDYLTTLLSVRLRPAQQPPGRARCPGKASGRPTGWPGRRGNNFPGGDRARRRIARR